MVEVTKMLTLAEASGLGYGVELRVSQDTSGPFYAYKPSTYASECLGTVAWFWRVSLDGLSEAFVGEEIKGIFIHNKDHLCFSCKDNTGVFIHDGVQYPITYVKDMDVDEGKFIMVGVVEDKDGIQRYLSLVINSADAGELLEKYCKR